MHRDSSFRKGPEEEPRPAGMINVDVGDEYKVKAGDPSSAESLYE